ncbi:MAG: glycosyl hydrolase family 65 protein [Actinomycetota bacterium]
MTAIGEHVRTDTGWEVVDTAPIPTRGITVGSNFMVGNGYLGYRGTRPDQRATDFVACVVSDTYDMADGVWRELCTVPNALYVAIRLDGEPLTIDLDQPAEVEYTLATAEVTQRWRATTSAGESASVSVRRFASLDDLHVVMQQITVIPDRDGPIIEFDRTIDTDVWSLNGTHLVEIEPQGDHEVRAVTGEGAIEIRVARRDIVEIGAASGTIISAMGVASSNDDLNGVTPHARARESAASAVALGYREALTASAEHWTRFWAHSDVQVSGDDAAQAALRFSLLHNRIATPAHTDRLPIGARGLSCQAYQGAAFWDQEMFNLPAFLHTEPDVARNILVYRWRTLDGARRKARRLGYEGAYFAWISGTTGDELCPDFFFTDVLSGRPIRNHFNVWQMHVSPDIAHAVWRYWEATHDLDFLADYGAEIVFEVARFLRSFVKYDEVRERYENIRLLGPDEWHENVDNNAYTNRLTQMTLDHALAIDELLATQRPSDREQLHTRLALNDSDLAAWRRIRDHIYIAEPEPDTGLIEAFDGFFELEDVLPSEVRSRLIDPSEYWGWPNGVAVHTQVSKQPDVVQLFAVDHTHPLDVQRANYDYYEPRCAKGSSLSHSVHAMVATRLAALDPTYLLRAERDFFDTATIDLLATQHAAVGGTFIGGIHTAATAGAYNVAVYGFGGVAIENGTVRLDPVLPATWTELRFRLAVWGQRLDVVVDSQRVTITADATNGAPVELAVGGQSRRLVAPGESVDAPLRRTTD